VIGADMPSMQDLKTIFHGKRITQMGLGLLGRGIGDAAFLARHGAELTVTDMKSREELLASLRRLKPYEHIRYMLGAHDRKDFEARDLILKGAGVPHDSSHIAHARTQGIPIDMSASLFARIVDIPMIGITGTRGKSTVTSLIEQILRAAGRTVLLGGNVRGVSNLTLLEKVTPDTTAVFELDSWQLQGFAEERSLDAPGVRQGPHSPHIAVFTTFLEDHMNYYHGDTARYLEDKAQIFLGQTNNDIVVIGRQALEALSPYLKRMRGKVIIADEHELPERCKVPLLGVHNRYNAGLAVATARALGIGDDTIWSAVQAAKPMPGRLEYLRTVRGIDIYNDNNATTPDATAAALHALDPEGKRNVILIAGGADKGLDTTVLREAVLDHVKSCVFLPGTGTERLLKECDMPRPREAQSLALAVEAACDIAESGDIVLFSPACASFGLFTNEYERNDQFEQLVRERV